MALNSRKIEKILRPVTPWVQPIGQVTGAIFVQPEMESQCGEEPADVLNQETPFLVRQKQYPEEIRFYNRAAIVRAEFSETGTHRSDVSHTYKCKLMMMDGTEMSGTLHESLPSEYSHLYDYLHQKAEQFIKLHCDNGITYLVNKTDVTQVVSEDG